MFTSDERQKRAKRLMIWYEVTCIGLMLLLVLQLILRIEPLRVVDYQRAVIFQDEILVPVEVGGLSIHGVWTRSRTRAISVVDGRIREIDDPGPGIGWVADRTRLWAISTNEVVESDGASSQAIQPKRVLRTVLGQPFLYESRPAVVEFTETLDQVRFYFLLVWQDGDWHEQARISLPGVGRQWEVQGQDHERTLVPLTGHPSARDMRAGPELLSVISCAAKLHQFHRDGRQAHIYAYRQGFDFIEETDEHGVSALAPENATAESSGWKAITQFGNANVKFGATSRHVIAMCFDFSRFTSVVYQQSSDPGDEKAMVFEPIEDSSGSVNESMNEVLISSAKDGSVYAINRRFASEGSTRITRYRDGKVEVLPIRIPGPFDSLVTQLKTFVVLTILLIAVAAMVLPILGTRLRNKSDNTVIWCGHNCVRLASLNRRYLARFLDGLMIVMPLLVWIYPFVSRIDGDWLLLVFQGVEILNLESFVEPMRLARFYAIFAMMIWLILVFVQGRYGLTLGKWLCGIRVLTTRLNPCGIARSLLREVMMFIDIGEPGMIALMISDHQQRIGDRYADTVVLDEASLRALKANPSAPPNSEQNVEGQSNS